MIKKISLFIAIVFAVVGVVKVWERYVAEKSLVIISTSDIHAKVENFPQLATAVKLSQDTVLTMLVDAGDRWTGNAYVDMAKEPRRPVIDMMNEMGYDVATLGNHEFDDGQAFLGHINSITDFDIVCANCLSDTITFPQPPAYKIYTRGGIKIGFVGVITNYDRNNRPAGKEESYVGLRFPDPQQVAMEQAEEIRGKCDVLVLLSHMGDDMDHQLAQKCDAYDMIVCGHTHNLVDTLVNRTLLGQSGNNCKRVGVTYVKMKGTKIKELKYDIVELKDYAPDPFFAEWVERLHDNEALATPVGESRELLYRAGLAAWEVDAVKRALGVDIALYHRGGIRFNPMPSTQISVGDIYGLEPFSSTIYTMTMTPAQLRQMIITKYNDTENPKESHSLDIYSNIPYTIYTDTAGEAVDVEFVGLNEEEKYSVAMGDYMYANYKGIEAENVATEGILLTDILLNDLRANSPIDYSNEPVQKIEKR
ncbi:MAG: bifunctional metallophosphatase/5'-nucleotidase [Rikenellaceae bacterium]|nr:bifunctional metallophosphatase/5'-nucleotidase [Rikenellaceae bacterium]